MESVYEMGLDIARWLQENYPWLRTFLEYISEAGRFEFYLGILPLIYWSLDKQLARNLVYLLAFSDVANSIAKHALRGPRPYWLDSSLQLSDEESYGIPSGHAQSAFVAYIYLAVWLRQRWVWLAAVLIVFLMGLSRVYLGVHFFHDVLAGYLVGLVIVVGYLVWRRYGLETFRQRILGQRLLIAILIPLAFGLLYAAIRLLIGEPDQTAAWASFIPDAETTSLRNVASALGALLGVGCGFVLEGSRVRFRADGPIWKRILRIVVGFVGVLVVWRGLGLILPTEPIWLGLPLRIFRYFLLGIWASYYGPMVFVRLRLAEAHPAPAIDMSMRSLDRIQPPKE